MILSEEETLQRPKLPTDPSNGPTNREPTQTDVATSSSPPRPSSPNPSLPPDYVTSQAQQPSTQKQWGAWRFWNGRVRKVVLYALVVYTSIGFIIGIPTFVLVSCPITTMRFPYPVQLRTELLHRGQMDVTSSDGSQ